MNGQQISQFQSHIDGRNATVTVYPDRLEWARPGRSTFANVSLIVTAIMFCGLTLIFRGLRPKFRGESQFLAVRAIVGVTSSPAGPATTHITVTAGANPMRFTVRRDLAASVEMTLRQLTLGSHPAQHA